MSAPSSRLARATAGALMALAAIWGAASLLPSLDDLNRLFLRAAYRQYERAARDETLDERRVEEMR